MIEPQPTSFQKSDRTSSGQKKLLSAIRSIGSATSPMLSSSALSGDSGVGRRKLYIMPPTTTHEMKCGR